MKPEFVHLHVHSHYSLLDGLGKIDDLLQRAKELGMKALALTDHGSMHGMVEFFTKSKEYGIRPIIGCEVYVAPGGMENKRPRIDEKRHHLILLAKNEEGYKNLIRLVTDGHLRGFYYKPRVDKEFLRQYSGGLIATSACIAGEVANCIISNEIEKATAVIAEYQDIFGKDDFYLEVEHHQRSKEQAKVNEIMKGLSQKTGAKIVATCDVHYVNPEDKEIQDVLLCIQQNKKVDDRDRLNMSEFDLYLKSPKEMQEHFRDLPEALAHTVEVAEKCNFYPDMGHIVLPHFDIPGGADENDYLREKCLVGLQERYGTDPDPKVLERLEFELDVIKRMGYASYFLIVADFVNWAKDKKIVVGPGRGSAAGSIVSYLTKITNVDPIRYELLFERFLNPERISMPDIDVDFADNRRDEVIDYVANKYGHDKVAQIITFGTMAARAAIRDAGRALNYPYDFCDKIAKQVPAFTSLKQAIEKSSEFRKMYEADPAVARVVDTARKLEGVARHASTHACGIVITKQPLIDYVPLQLGTGGGKDGSETVITQVEGKSIETLGLLKMDFLGLKNLTILQNVIDIIRAKYGTEVDLDTIPLDDSQTLQLFQKGETTGVFQFESSGFKRYLRELKPTRFQDLIDMVALYRPGPMDWIPDYIAGKHGKRKITYLHPKLKPILEKTYGIIVVQEQVMEIAKQLAGFTAGEADYLRKAMGKKIKKLMDEQRDKFILGCINHGIKGKTAEKIWDFIKPFAGYGFNWAHSACYAMIGYQTAYFKAHYPVEFMAALLSSDENDTDRIAIEIEECKKMGIPVLPPDVNESFGRFGAIGEGDKAIIRYGLNAVKNVGKKVAHEIIEERKRSGKYKDIADLAVRVNSKDLNKKSLESLGKSGALDSLGKREEILANVEKILKFAREVKEIKERGQASLFGGGFDDKGGSEGYVLQLTEKIEITKKDRLSWEKELLGLYISENPLSEYEAYLSGETTSIAKLNQEYLQRTEDGESQVVPYQGNGGGRNGYDRGNGKNRGPAVTVGGIITKTKKIYTRNNKEMLFAELEDLSGKLEVVVFPNVYAKLAEVWKEDAIVWVKGTVNDKDGSIKILCDDAGEIKEQMKEYKKVVSPASGIDSNNETVDIPSMPSQLMTIEYDGQGGGSADVKNLLRKLISGHDRIILNVFDSHGKATKIKIAGCFQLSGDRFDELAAYLKANTMPYTIKTCND